MAAGDPGSPARYYSSTAVETALGSSIPAQSQNQANTSFIVGSISGFPTDYPYTLIVDPDTSKEEVVTVYAGSGTTLSVYRGSDNTQAVAHSAGAVVRHGVSGREFRESENHIAARGYDIDQTILNAANQTHVHGIATGDGVIVGTLKTQTLTNKTLTSPVITNPSISGAGVDASIVFEGATADAHETTLTVVDPTQDNTITLPNTTGTVVIATAVQTLTNKTIDMTGATLTGLSSAGMVASSATPKNYVDAILGSATAAATSAASAAVSATSAATSASSAAASATASASSASASATSASAAATSATSAAASATAAATSATSAAASATAAATSATSAAASAATAAASVATISGFATASANSASAAATSAASAATSASSAAASAASIVGDAVAAATSAASASASATAAATSAASAATSAGAAATSATASANSASAAATSANSAATSASSALTSANSAATSAASAAASTSAAAASASAAATSAASAATSASSAATTYDEFDDRYLGSKSTPPTVDNDGNPLIEGALYWNSVDNAMYAWTGTEWGSISSTAAIYRYRYTASGGETSESGPDDNGVTLSYLPGKEQVYLNGVLLVRGEDYTASNGTSISGLSPALASGDVLEIITFTAFDLTTAIPNTIFDAKGDLIVASTADTPGKLSVGTDGQVLTAASTTALGVTWTTISGYSAPTLGSTTINSGATVTTISGLTLAGPTLSGTVTASGDINLTAVGAVGSINDEFALILMGAV
jgi:hypothetical protein